MTFQTTNNETKKTDVHLLSFDVEEYFQVEAVASAIPIHQWDTYPARLAPVITRILTILAENQTKATFFVLGWVAQHEKQLVHEIAEQGHEIASHGMSHTMLGRLTPEDFRQELRDSRRVLEDITGQRVIGFRAPTFSITHKTAWALDILAEEGFLYDSSIFPVHHDRYGVPDAPTVPHRAMGSGTGGIIEIPPLTTRLFGVNWPIGGGGYLRLLPARMIDLALRKARHRQNTGMLYMHPWEFDPDQPILPMRRMSRWRHRVGLRHTETKLCWLLKRHRFVSTCQVMDALDASTKICYRYGLCPCRSC